MKKRYRDIFPTLIVINTLINFYIGLNLLYNKYWIKSILFINDIIGIKI